MNVTAELLTGTGFFVRGSLALWVDPSKTCATANPALTLHFNMWSDLPGGADVLDVGILFEKDSTPNALYLYFPGDVPKTAFKDLFEKLKGKKTLAAVFNETLQASPVNPDVIKLTGGAQLSDFNLIKLDDANVDFQTIAEADGKKGTVIVLNSGLFSKFMTNEQNYVRFRITLAGELIKIFTSSAVPTDGLFASTFYRTAFVEFRINERRNFSEGLLAAFPGMQPQKIKGIHFFLVRDISAELTRSHADFKKMRRLEPGLWTDYLSEFGNINVENMIIYHWRKPLVDGRDDPVDDFMALCGFRKPRINIVAYLAAFVLIGALGNSMQAAATVFTTTWLPSLIGNGWSTALYGQIALFAGFSLIIFILYRVFKYLK